MRYALVLLGGALGAVARYVVDGWVASGLGPGFPFGTLVVNLSSSFLLGVVAVVTLERSLLLGEWRIFLGVGLLGAYTTFFTWQYETLRLLETGPWAAGLANLLGSAVAGLAALALGVVVARVL
ncbi:MAG: fluoride efflux transporter CrcB [candidate division GAL15 bacterium]